MKATHDKILVRCDDSQKDSVRIWGKQFKMALPFETNYRVKSPTVCFVVDGNAYVKAGDVLLTHHNLFYKPSPYHLYDDIFSVPFSKVLFGIIQSDGSVTPICGNIFGKKVDIETAIPLPPEQRSQYTDRIIVEKSSNPKYKKDQLLFTRPSSPYDIIYHWGDEQRTITKISDDMVCGVLVPTN